MPTRADVQSVGLDKHEDCMLLRCVRSGSAVDDFAIEWMGRNLVRRRGKNLAGQRLQVELATNELARETVDGYLSVVETRSPLCWVEQLYGEDGQVIRFELVALPVAGETGRVERLVVAEGAMGSSRSR